MDFLKVRNHLRKCNIDPNVNNNSPKLTHSSYCSQADEMERKELSLFAGIVRPYSFKLIFITLFLFQFAVLLQSE